MKRIRPNATTGPDGKVSMNDTDYATLSLLKNFEAAIKKDPYALDANKPVTISRVTQKLKMGNSSTVLQKLVNLGFATIKTHFTVHSSVLGTETYKITNAGLIVLAERPEKVPVINNGGSRDYRGPQF